MLNLINVLSLNASRLSTDLAASASPYWQTHRLCQGISNLRKKISMLEWNCKVIHKRKKNISVLNQNYFHSATNGVYNVAHRSKPTENGSLQNSDSINKTVVTTSTGRRLPLRTAFIVESPWGSVLSPKLEGGFSVNFQILLVIGSWNNWLGTAKNKLEALTAFVIKWWWTPPGNKAWWRKECMNSACCPEPEALFHTAQDSFTWGLAYGWPRPCLQQ